MVTYSLPEGDDSIMSDEGSIVNEDSGMDIEGDSFDAAVQVINQAQNQAQNQSDIQHPSHVARFQNQQQREQNNTATTPPTHISRDCLMTYEVPSSTGKRKRNEAQQLARDSYHSQPDPTTESTAPRRIGGMFTSMYILATTLLAGIWSFITRHRAAVLAQNAEDQEILAVETDHSGRKRRAVPSGRRRSSSQSPNSQGSTSNSSPTSSSAQNQASQSTSPTMPTATDEVAIKTSSPAQNKSSQSTSSTMPKPIDEAAITSSSASASSSAQDQSSQSSTSTMPTVIDEAAIKPSSHTTPGAFPSAEQSQTPVPQQRNTIPEIGRKNGYRPPVNPYDGSWDNTTFTEPTVDEYYRRFPGEMITPVGWEQLATEKREWLRGLESEEYYRWGEFKDAEKFDEELEFEQKEEDLKHGDMNQASLRALRKKFGENATKEDLEALFLHHEVHHKQIDCSCNEFLQKYHEYESLMAHETAKVYHDDVEQETKEYQAQLNAQERAAFRKTSFFKKKQGVSAMARTLDSQKKPKEWVALAGKDALKPTGATKEEDSSRPTTSSSQRRPDLYKEGIMPSPPQGGGPGATSRKPWSYNKTMMPAKSSLKQKSRTDLKDEKVNQLIEKSKKITLLSPQEKHVKGWIQEQRQFREVQRAQVEDNKQYSKEAYFKKSTLRREDARIKLEELKQQWEDSRVAEAEKKRAEEEEAARRVAEELARQKAIEDQLARQKAEKAAKLKAIEEEKARQIAAQKKLEEEKAAQAEKDRLSSEAEEKAAWDEKQKLIRPLDPAWDERVKKALETKGKQIPLAKALTGAELTRHDFGTILPQEGTDDDSSGWLNDEIINGWFKAICERKNEQQGWYKGATPTYEAYNCGWFSTYKAAGSMESIKRWSKRKGIAGPRLLDAEKLFFPINSGSHWTLLIISPRERRIEYLDSLDRSSAPYFRIAREWLAMELGEELYHANEWAEGAARSSRQANSDDCGVFVAMNGLAAAKGYPFDVVRAGKMKEARRTVAAVLLNGGMVGDWEL